MSREAEYEKGWDVCVRCGTRRPVRAMEGTPQGWGCRDFVWCLAQASRVAASAPAQAPAPRRRRKR